MGLAMLSMKAFVPAQTPEPNRWEKMLRSACETLARMPELMARSISVTGSLHGFEGEAQYVLILSKRLGQEYGLKQVVEVKGHCFTARFWRRDPEPSRKGR